MSVNQPESINIQVSTDGHGCRIDQWLANQRSEFSRSYWTDKIKSAQVLLNEVACLPKTKLKSHDLITLLPASFEPCEQISNEAQAIALDIVFEDDHLLILNKPAGLVVHPGAGNHDQTLLNGLLHHHPEAINLPRAGIVHRLDKDTTGVMVVSKTMAAYNQLTCQMQDRQIKRHYIALVYGHIISGDTIHTHFGRHSRNRLKMAVAKQGKEAITHYTIAKKFPDYTLLDVVLDTGRTHQIRVHMAHIGHPIVGDQLYGKRIHIPKKADEALKANLQSFKRQALHAHSLAFEHPMNQAPLTFSTPLPDDFTHLLSALKIFYESNHS